MPLNRISMRIQMLAIYLSAAPDPEVKILLIFPFFKVSVFLISVGDPYVWASRIRIQIRFGSSSGSFHFHHQAKIVEKPCFFCFVTSLWLFTSVPEDPCVFGHPWSRSVSQRYPGTVVRIRGSGSVPNCHGLTQYFGSGSTGSTCFWASRIRIH